MKEFIEIPFGAKDSELCGWEYTIPEGFVASIENGKIIVKKEESEGEKIRKEIIFYFQQEIPQCSIQEHADKMKEFIVWLEKQGEQKPINYADEEIVEAVKDTSILDMVEPKFKVGDWVVDEDDNHVHQIERVIENVTSGKFAYDLVGGGYFPSTKKNYHLWHIQDAKDGDVLATDNDSICIFDGTVEEGKYPFAYCGLTRLGFESYDKTLPFTHNDVHPATKEQRDLLFQKMKELGYEWDAEKKEVKKIEQNPAWSKKDEERLNQLHKLIVKKAYEEYEIDTDDETLYGKWLKLDNWLKSLKPQNIWKPSKEEMDVLYGLAYITNQYDEHKEEVITRLYQDLKREFFNGSSYENMFPNTEDGIRRRNTIQVLEPAWSEEDEEELDNIIDFLNSPFTAELCPTLRSNAIAWLKSLKDKVQPQWKPSTEQLTILLNAANGNYMSDSNRQVLSELYRNLKKL